MFYKNIVLITEKVNKVQHIKKVHFLKYFVIENINVLLKTLVLEVIDRIKSITKSLSALLQKVFI